MKPGKVLAILALCISAVVMVSAIVVLSVKAAPEAPKPTSMYGVWIFGDASSYDYLMINKETGRFTLVPNGTSDYSSVKGYFAAADGKGFSADMDNIKNFIVCTYNESEYSLTVTFKAYKQYSAWSGTLTQWSPLDI